MRRYLIHHDLCGTWDLVIEGGVWTVELTGLSGKQVFPVQEFKKSEDGARMADSLADAMIRATFG